MKIKTVNLEEGMPTVEQARTRLADELHKAKRDGARLLKIIHGYGSSGVGGALRDGILGSLARQKMDGAIEDFIAGEDWRIADASAWQLLKQFPELKNDSDLGRGNRGITIVLL